MPTGAIVNVVVEGTRDRVVRETVAAIRAEVRSLLKGTGVIVNVVARVKSDSAPTGSKR